MITGFASVLEYSRFAMAKGFWDSRSNRVFSPRKNILERVGDVLTRPVLGGINVSLENYKSPPVISALALAAIAAATAFFYPEWIPAIPFLFLSAGQVKFMLYSTTVLTIMGLSLRTLGRLQGEMWRAWELRNDQGKRVLVPIPIGATLIS